MIYVCPNCEARCQFRPVGECMQVNKGKNSGRFMFPWKCTECNAVLVATSRQNGDWESAKLNPNSPTIKSAICVDEIEDIDLRSDYEEALEDFENGSNKSCAIMCRRAIQTICIKEKAQGKNLHEQIKSLKVHDDLKEWAAEVKNLGNDGAHPDLLLDGKLKEIAQEDAKESLEILERFIENVYLMPKRIKEGKAKRSQTT